MDDESIQKISQQLITTGFELWVVFISKNGTQFGFGDVEIREFKNVNDFGVAQFKRNPKLFHDVIICHGLESKVTEIKKQRVILPLFC